MQRFSYSGFGATPTADPNNSAGVGPCAGMGSPTWPAIPPGGDAAAQLLGYPTFQDWVISYAFDPVNASKGGTPYQANPQLGVAESAVCPTPAPAVITSKDARIGHLRITGTSADWLAQFNADLVLAGYSALPASGSLPAKVGPSKAPTSVQQIINPGMSKTEEIAIAAVSALALSGAVYMLAFKKYPKKGKRKSKR